MTFDFDADDLFSTPSKVSPELKKHNSPLLRGSRGSGSKPEPRQPSPRPVEKQQDSQSSRQAASPGPGESRLVKLARAGDLEAFYEEAAKSPTDWKALHDQAVQDADNIVRDAYRLVQRAATPEAKKEASANLRNAQDGLRDIRLWAP